MARLPTVGGDSGNWGTVLNEYLSQAHKADGTLRVDVASIADLKALDVSAIPDKMQVMVGGYYAHGDGGGGQFYYDAGSSDADNGGTIFAPTVGSGRWLRVCNNIFYPEWFGARGDGTSDDTAALQATVDAAEGSPHSLVYMLPSVSYAVSATIDLGGGGNDTAFIGGAFSVNAPSNYTFTKIANVTVLRVVHLAQSHPKIVSISIKGRGNASPALTNPALDSTPGAIAHSKCTVRDVFISHTGGSVGGEQNTAGYAFGLYQYTNGNVNYAEIDGLSVVSCTGDGLYIGRQGGSIDNCNGVQAFVRQYLKCTGYAVNATTGFKNNYYVRHVAPSAEAMAGVFQLLYVENYARCQYAEGGTAKLVDFGSTGGRNRVACNDASSFSVICPDYRNNTVEDFQSGVVYVGNNSGGHQHSYIGSGGLAVDALRLPTPAGSASSSIEEAVTADYGGVVDILAGTAAGNVSWSGRAAVLAKVGMLTMVAFDLAGTVSSASGASARLLLPSATTSISVKNQSNKGVIGPLSLVNSGGTQLVYLRNNNTERWDIITSAGAGMTFDGVVGANTFTLCGTVAFLDASGQE